MDIKKKLEITIKRLDRDSFVRHYINNSYTKYCLLEHIYQYLKKLKNLEKELCNSDDGINAINTLRDRLIDVMKEGKEYDCQIVEVYKTDPVKVGLSSYFKIMKDGFWIESSSYLIMSLVRIVSKRRKPYLEELQRKQQSTEKFFNKEVFKQLYDLLIEFAKERFVWIFDSSMDQFINSKYMLEQILGEKESNNLIKKFNLAIEYLPESSKKILETTASENSNNLKSESEDKNVKEMPYIPTKKKANDEVDEFLAAFENPIKKKKKNE